MRHAAAVVLYAVLSLSLQGQILVPLGVHTGRYLRPTLTVLHDGRVLIAGGDGSSNALDLFDPSTLMIVRSRATTALPLIGHTATLLPDGRVLLTGGGYKTDGRPGFGNYGDRAIAIYDPATDRVEKVAEMSAERFQHTATPLGNGTVLLTGGEVQNVGGFHLYRTPTATADIFDPSTNSVRPVGPMHAARSGHSATLLADGRVFILGTPRDFYGEKDGESCEIYDPVTASFTEVLSMPRVTTQQALLLPDDRVLVPTTQQLYLIDPRNASWAPSSAAIGFPAELSPTLLATGQVLLLTEVAALTYDPAADEIVRETPFGVTLIRAATATLPGNRLLVVDDDVYLLLGQSQRRRAVR